MSLLRTPGGDTPLPQHAFQHEARRGALRSTQRHPNCPSTTPRSMCRLPSPPRGEGDSGSGSATACAPPRRRCRSAPQAKYWTAERLTTQRTRRNDARRDCRRQSIAGTTRRRAAALTRRGALCISARRGATATTCRRLLRQHVRRPQSRSSAHRRRRTAVRHHGTLGIPDLMRSQLRSALRRRLRSAQHSASLRWRHPAEYASSRPLMPQ